LFFYILHRAVVKTLSRVARISPRTPHTTSSRADTFRKGIITLVASTGKLHSHRVLYRHLLYTIHNVNISYYIPRIIIIWRMHLHVGTCGASTHKIRESRRKYKTQWKNDGREIFKIVRRSPIWWQWRDWEYHIFMLCRS